MAWLGPFRNLAALLVYVKCFVNGNQTLPSHFKIYKDIDRTGTSNFQLLCPKDKMLFFVQVVIQLSFRNISWSVTVFSCLHVSQKHKHA